MSLEIIIDVITVFLFVVIALVICVSRRPNPVERKSEEQKVNDHVAIDVSRHNEDKPKMTMLSSDFDASHPRLRQLNLEHNLKTLGAGKVHIKNNQNYTDYKRYRGNVSNLERSNFLSLKLTATQTYTQTYQNPESFTDISSVFPMNNALPAKSGLKLDETVRTVASKWILLPLFDNIADNILEVFNGLEDYMYTLCRALDIYFDLDVSEMAFENLEDTKTTRNCGVSSLLVASVYMESLSTKIDNKNPKSINWKLLCAVVLWLAAKFLEDEPISTEFWTMISGWSEQQLESAEKFICETLHWQLFVNQKEIKQLCRRYEIEV